MEIAEILSQFKRATGKFPQAAVEAAVERREEIVPKLLRILDETIRPEPFHQNFFVDNAAAALDEDEERLEHLRFQWHGLATAQQTTFFHVERESAELVQLLSLLAHNGD